MEITTLGDFNMYGNYIIEKGDYLFNVEGYYKDLKNILEESQRNTRNFLGQTNVTNIYAGTGIAKGIEFLAQKKSGDLNGWVSYTLGQARNHFDVYSDTYYPGNQDDGTNQCLPKQSDP